MKKSYLLLSAIVGLSINVIAQTVSTFMGTPGIAGINVATSTFANAQFAYPANMIVDKSGKMWVIEAAGGSSSIGNRLRVLVDMTTPASVYHRAGSASGSGGYSNGTGIGLSLFNNPTGIVTDTLGNIYIADAGNNAIRKVNAYVNVGTPQTATTFAGSATGASGNVDNLGTAASFNTPTDLAIDSLGIFM